MAFACRHDRLLLRTVAAGMLVVVALRSAMLRAQSPAPPDHIAPLPAAQADQPAPHERVIDIRVDGNRMISREKVLANIGTKVNHPFDQATFDADVRKLVGKSWFVHVEPIRQRTPGGIIITLRVVERPVLEAVQYLGWRKVKPKTLAKQTGLKKGDPLDPYAVEEAARKLETFYQTKGFNDIKVEVLEGDKPSDRRAVFLINEGRIQKVSKVRFEGNQIASDGRLKTQIQSKPPVLYLFKGYVDRAKIEGDVERLTDYYRGLGFFKAHVGRDYEWDEDEQWMTLVFYITEGPRYKIRDISFAGNSIYDNAALAEGLKLKRGDYFDRTAMNADIGYIKDVYGANGYVFADAQPDLQFDLHPGELDLLYKVTEGQQCLVGDINVHIGGDNPHTRLITAINRVGFRPGDVIDIRQVRATERRLKAAGIFNVDPSKGDLPRVVLSPPDEEGEGPDGDRRNVAQGSGSGARGQSPDPPQRGPTVRYQSPAGTSSAYGGTAVNELSPGGMSYTAASGTATTQNPYTAAIQGVKQPSAFGAPVNSAPAPAAPNRYAQPAGQYSANPYTQSYTQPSAGYPSQQPAVQSAQPAVYQSQPNAYTAPPGAYAAQPAQYQAPAAAAPYPYAQPAAGYPQASGTAVAQAPGGGYSTQPPIVGAPPAGTIYGQGGAPGGYPSGYGAGPADQPGGGLLPSPTPEPLLDSRPQVPVDIYLNEAQTGRFMFGAGVNSNAGLVGSIVLDEQNFDWRRFPTSWEDFRSGRAFRGDGQKFRIEAAPGTQVSRYMFNFAEPYLFDTPVSFGLSGYYFQRFYRDWNEQRTGGRTSLGYQFSPDLSGALAFRGEDVLINGVRAGIDPATVPPLEDALGHTQMYSFTGTMAWDTRDSTFLPTEGNYIALSVGYTVGTFQFPTYTVDFRKFFMLRQRPDGSGRHVLSLYNQFGITGSDTPIYERFYAGGFSTLRGFQFRGASPQINTVEVGGDFQNLSSVEYMFPLTADDMLRAVVFVDFGTVEETVTIVWDQFRVAPGAGLRISLPALGPAPIALDIAVPVAYADTDIKQLFSFFVGYSR